MEAALCEYLTAVLEPHVHSTYEMLSFTVSIGPKRQALFTPSILLTHTRKDRLNIVIEPIDSIRPGGGLRRLQGFCRRYGNEYFAVVVARHALHPHIPADAYHLLLPLEDFALPLDHFLKAL
jgi:hypothetical protein